MKFETSAVPQSAVILSQLYSHRFNYCPVFLDDPQSQVPAQEDDLVNHIIDFCDCV